MVLMMTNLRDYCLENHKNLLVVKCLALYGKVLGTILGSVDGISIELDVGL